MTVSFAIEEAVAPVIAQDAADRIAVRARTASRLTVITVCARLAPAMPGCELDVVPLCRGLHRRKGSSHLAARGHGSIPLVIIATPAGELRPVTRVLRRASRRTYAGLPSALALKIKRDRSCCATREATSASSTAAGDVCACWCGKSVRGRQPNDSAANHDDVVVFHRPGARAQNATSICTGRGGRAHREPRRHSRA